MTEVGIVAYWFPGMGSPLEMPIDVFDSLLMVFPTVRKMSKSALTNRELVELG